MEWACLGSSLWAVRWDEFEFDRLVATQTSVWQCPIDRLAISG